ncbi:MAG: hydrogenase iron-sulfur subunit [Desulfarculaceae bacterium]|nr:hydrogenase iron-sulfur subunit [Desulfarculaceae bacterium]MCF8121917.1 hydrogenase iron-sulfur subunit [Desulfarculaceae bacterium]
MAKLSLLWVDTPGLEDLDPALVAKAAGMALDQGGLLEAAVVTTSQEQAPAAVRQRLMGLPVAWLELAAEVGGGPEAHRLARAAVAVSRAAGRAAKGTLPPVYAPQPAQSVLVAGAGYSALAAAWEAAAMGHPVTLATPFDSVDQAGADDDPEAVSLLAAQLPAQVDLAPNSELTRLTGAAGGFNAWLSTNGDAPQTYGAVFLAPSGELVVGCEVDGLDPALCRPVSGLNPEDFAGPEDGWLHVAVLAGTAEAVPSYSFSAAMQAALALAERPKVQVSLLFSEARVAAPGGEKLFRDCREAGVLAVRVGPGKLEVRQGGRELAWADPLLGEELELAPAAIVLAEQATAARPAWLDNDLLVKPWDELVPDNPRLAGGRTSRTGLFITGALRGTSPGEARRDEAASAAAAMHQALTGKVVPMPAVRDNFCASCLTCVRTCPHGVPRYTVDHIQCAPAGCVACGACAAECPAEAIAPPSWGNPEMFSSLEWGLALAPEPKMVLFACAASGMPAVTSLSAQGHQWPAGLVIYPLVCAARMSQLLLLRALEMGAQRVLVAGCHPGNCRSITGNHKAMAKIASLSGELAALGLPTDALEFLPLASNQTRELASAVRAMAQKAGEE